MELTKSQNLLYIENCFYYMLCGKIEQNISSIQKTLNREFKDSECVEIMYTKTNITQNFFGMRIYPAEKDLERISKDVLEDNSPTLIKHYIIEMDSKLLDPFLGLTASELTAILMHEIGHIINTTEIQREVQSTFKMYKLQANKGGNSFNPRAYKYMYKLLYLYVIDSFANFNIYRMDMKTEKSADKFVITRGYGDDLNSAFHKIVVKGYYTKKNEKGGTLCVWSIQNMIAIGERQRIVAQELDTEMKQAENPYVKNIIKEMLKMISGSNNELREATGYCSNFLEQEALNENAVLQAFIESIFKPSFNIHERDIDILAVEVDMVEDHYEKINVLEKIHDRLNKVDKYLAKTNKLPSADVEYLSAYKTQIQELQKKLIAKKIVDKQYGVFIKYPVGYEG